MAMQPLSRESEQRLLGAVAAVADQVSAGSSPNDAIVKTAVDRQIPRGHIQLMVNAYNTGRTEFQRRTSDDVIEKAGEFELADAAQVLERLYPETTKTAADLRHDRRVDPSYSKPPHFLAARAQREKRAQDDKIDWSVPGQPVVLPRDPALPVKKAMAERQKNRSAVEDARWAAQAVFDRMQGEINKLASSLRVPGATNFHTLKQNASLLFGKPAAKLCDYLAADNRALVKQAVVNDSGPVHLDEHPYSDIQNIIRLAEDYLTKRAAHETLVTETARREVELLGPFVAGALSTGGVLGLSSRTELRKEAFLGGLFGAMIGNTAGSAMGKELSGQLGGRPVESMLSKAKDKITDPQHEMSLRNLQTESMLNDFMANDDVISGHDPNEVLRHFNELSQLAPRASNQSGLMRSLLRKRLQQGAVDPYEVDMLLKIENGLRMRDGASQGVMSDGSSGVLG